MDNLTLARVPPGRIDLAREADFRLGALTIRPSRREVEAGGVPHVLQRRVMQVLVALATSNNKVVSQQELILRCWGGLSVSDDAIGRCIGQLRRLAASWSRPPFEIETIAGVGYRLEAAPVVAGEASAVATRFGARSATRWRLAAVALAAAPMLALAAWLAQRWLSQPSPLPPTPIVEVRPMNVIGADPSLPPLAARVSDALAGFLGDSGVRVVTGAGVKPQLAFGGSVSSADGQLRLRLYLAHTPSETALWSRDYVEPVGRSDALVDAADGGAMETINLLRSAGSATDPETLALVVRGGATLVAPTFDERLETDAVRQFEQALQRHPESGVLRASYAWALTLQGLDAQPAERAELFAKARGEAQRVIREHHAQSGVAYNVLLTIAQAEAPRDWVGAETRLAAALRSAPEDPLLYANRCDFLLRVGRAAESLHFCRLALALRPHTAPFLVAYAEATDAVGELPQLADHLLAEGARLYPDDTGVRVYRFARDAFAGSTGRALALLHDPATTPPINPNDVRAIELLEKARATGTNADADAAIAAARAGDAHAPLDDFRFLTPMALGRMDEAYSSPDLVLAEEDEVELLTFRFTDKLRRDPRFWPLAARAGLVRYWITTGKWPDFCSDPTYPLDCRAQARRVAAIVPPVS